MNRDQMCREVAGLEVEIEGLEFDRDDADRDLTRKFGSHAAMDASIKLGKINDRIKSLKVRLNDLRVVLGSDS